MKKVLSILGSTGSIGTSTLEVVTQFPDRFSVGALAAHTNVDLLVQQIAKFKPSLAVVKDEPHASRLKEKLPRNTSVKVAYGEEGYQEAAALDEAEIVVGAMVGAAGLLPMLTAIDAGKSIALANKETLVMAGDLVMAAVDAKGVALLPVDSEHSAIFQCLSGNRRQDLKKILLTASGGPFRQLAAEKFKDITRQDALNHPNWSMGNKITIDSATLMNKGLEVIEAKWLFAVSAQEIEVVVHPESIIHSMVAFKDGSIMAQLGIPDMRGAIALALSHPERLPLNLSTPDFSQLRKLTFEEPDLTRFPCLEMAYKACDLGGTAPAVLNAANEIAVDAFLKGNISFITIPQVIKDTLNAHACVASPDLNAILAADEWARAWAQMWIDKKI